MHHAVIRKEAVSSKLRIVYNGSLKVGKNPSLNDCLHSGPSLIPKIFDILLHFRWFQVPLTADISKAFLQISIKPEDREYLRFLWVNDIQVDNPQILILRFLRLVFGITSSPFGLMGTIFEHVSQYKLEDPTFVNKVERDTYMDDIITGTDSVDEWFELFLKLKSRFADAKFTLHKFLSSSPELMNKIQQQEKLSGQISDNQSQLCDEDLSYAKLTLNTTETPVDSSSKKSKVLCHTWDCESDIIEFNFEKLADYAKSLQPLTKRNIPRVTAKLFDPLGIVSPVFIKNKILFQKLSKKNWDESVDENVRKDWVKWVDDLSAVKFITLPRCYFKGQIEILNSTLHVFTDASVLAFAAVIYLVIQTQSEYFSSLVTSKTRVAPLTDISLPRLELLGALTGARLINCVHEALTDVLRVNEIVCWSDSLVTLYWIKGINKHFKQFVENRTSKIRKNTEIQFWRHCPGTLNPADIPTRGMSAAEFADNDLWFKGPDFIRKPKEFWPEDISADIKEPPSDALVEERTVINLIELPKRKCVYVYLWNK